MMENINFLRKNCCGCASCQQVCPEKCIKFIYDREGFLYPFVNEDDCISCGLCIRSCPIHTDVSRGKHPKVYASKVNDSSLARESTSGGVFSTLAEQVLKCGGVVYGCAFDNKLSAHHIAVTERSMLSLLRGSKYVQSDTRGIFEQVKQHLLSGKTVLFSGTGCQVAGLKAFLGKEYENLILVDIICHGVPSPKLFERYIKWLGIQLGNDIISYNFRSKEKQGWGLYYKAETEHQCKTDNGFFDPYYNAFLSGKTYRECCYSCRFANTERPSDITLGDFWGIEAVKPSFYDKNGVSLVLVNTDKGEKIWKDIKEQLSVCESNIEQAVKMNHNLSAPSSRPNCRDTIYDGFDGDFNEYIQDKLSFNKSFSRRIKTLIPVFLKGWIKYILKY